MDKVTCIAIGDPHFKVKNVVDTQVFIKKINILVKNVNPTFVVVLGDLLHDHEKVHVTPFNLATRLLLSLASKVKVFLLVGNHDYCNNAQYLSNKHPFNSFKKVANIVVCDKVVSHKIGDKKFIFCPYVPPDRFEEALNTIEEKGIRWDNATCIFAHQEFYGCRFNPETTSTDGDVWPEEYPLVVSGHIHDEQWLQPNIYYTGSSMQHAFGESPHKTIALLTFKKKGKYDLKKVDLEMRKKKIVYRNIVDCETFIPQDNTLTKLSVRGTTAQYKVFRRSKTYTKLIALGVTISHIPEKSNYDDIVPDLEKKSVLEILEKMIENDNKYVADAFKKLQQVN